MKNAAIALALLSSVSQATVVTLTPTDIHGGDTTTVSFSNSDIALTPLVGGAATTFNSAAARLGADPVGTSNANGFADPDTTAGNSNDETLVMDLEATVGLTQITFDFARAVGPLATDGVRISGFLSDPGASLSGGKAGETGGSVSYSSGILTLQLPLNRFFDNTDGILDLSDAAASAGQTLTLTVNSSTEAGALFPITSLSYNNAVPEPSVALLGALGLFGLLRRRR